MPPTQPQSPSSLLAGELCSGAQGRPAAAQASERLEATVSPAGPHRPSQGLPSPPLSPHIGAHLPLETMESPCLPDLLLASAALLASLSQLSPLFHVSSCPSPSCHSLSPSAAPASQQGPLPGPLTPPRLAFSPLDLVLTGAQEEGEEGAQTGLDKDKDQEVARGVNPWLLCREPQESAGPVLPPDPPSRGCIGEQVALVIASGRGRGLVLNEAQGHPAVWCLQARC